MTTAAEPARSTNYRALFLVLLFLIGFASLSMRLVQIQHVDQSTLSIHANRQHSFKETISARPGEILDRNGKVLATTITTYSLYVDPSRVESPQEFADAICTVVLLDPVELAARISSHQQKQFLWIKRRLSDVEANAIIALGLPEGCWGFRNEYFRSYPQGELAAHLLGLRDIDGHGRGGIEEAFDEVIQGQPGSQTFFRDARGRIFLPEDSEFIAPQPGRSIVLTLDMVIQFHVEQELNKLVEEWQPKSCCAIVMDPHSGEILGMASRPSFNPNYPENVAPAAWKNCAISAIYEPGSTFKPLIVASALDRGLISPTDTFDCEMGSYQMGRRTLHDHHRYGQLSVTDILVKSSNIGMAKIGERLQNAGLYQSATDYGFGRTTEFPVPGELPGKLRPFSDWDGYSTGSIPMGQEITATPLQMIRAHAALANGGFLVQPKLLRNELEEPWSLFLNGATVEDDATGDDSAKDPHANPVHSRRILSSDVADWIVQHPLAEVIDRGTGKKAKLKEYRLFGKTGTAQKVDPVTGKYSRLKNISSFICGGPVENPRLLVYVVADEPGAEKNAYGGQAAAPVAARIIKAALDHLQVPPQTSP
ncbi:Peptidoglycan D,D-transpeptidase FtsI [Polystyrenella longa]|uniref:Peptidoglycan D,D-transpeptidase FtsI n=1 Tax=Polystyrenella longa TaxID=2528007 RepID=A0A518CNP5_9PLAN|nr:penicillin-binding protein 2 [Polystyrenella longa]QDU80856.1 Peptidoglycan D,D-transpeptidase FtsI [Polystyrenella longa]